MKRKLQFGGHASATQNGDREMETMQPPEKRRMPRKHPRVPLVTQVEASSIGRTENISMGGMLVVTYETFEPETEVTFRFNLPSGHTIQGRGLVVHSQPKLRMGIQFLDLKEDDLKAIEEFVQQACEEVRAGEPSGAT